MDATIFCSPNASLGFFYNISLDFNRTIYCHDMIAVRNLIYPLLLHLLIFFGLIIFLVSFSVEIKEHFKYFILNGITIALLYGFYMDIYTLFFAQTIPFDFGLAINQIFHTYTYDLLLNTCFPIAINRFFYFYYTSLYNRFVGTKTLLLFIIIFDLLTIGIDYWSSVSSTIIWLVYLFLWMASTIIFAILVSVKIHVQTKLLSANTPVLSDAKRATVFCLLQAFISFINYLINGFNLAFMFYFFQDTTLYEIFINAYIFFSTMQDVINVLLTLCDAIITLVVLKTYRKVVVKFLKNLVTMVVYSKKKISITKVIPIRKIS